MPAARTLNRRIASTAATVRGPRVLCQGALRAQEAMLVNPGSVRAQWLAWAALSAFEGSLLIGRGGWLVWPGIVLVAGAAAFSVLGVHELRLRSTTYSP